MFFTIEFWEFFKSFVTDVVCKYFLSIFSFSFHLLNGVSHKTSFNFDEVNLLIFHFMDHVLVSENSLTSPRFWRYSPVFFFFFVKFSSFSIQDCNPFLVSFCNLGQYFSYKCLVAPASFIGKAIFHLLHWFCTFVRDLLGIFVVTYFWVLLPFLWCKCLSVHQYQSLNDVAT